MIFLPSDKTLSPSIFNRFYESLFHYRCFAYTNSVSYRLTSNPLIHLFFYRIILLNEPNPFRKFLANALAHGNLNLPWIYQRKIMHGQNSVSIYDGIFSNKSNRFCIMVKRSRNMMIETIYATSTPLKPPHIFPKKQLFTVNA